MVCVLLSRLSCVQVIGAGIPNPFRLKPYIGARVPVNSTFSPVIQIHNPFSSKLRVGVFCPSRGTLFGIVCIAVRHAGTVDVLGVVLHAVFHRCG